MTIEHKFFKLPTPHTSHGTDDAEYALKSMVDAGWEVMQVMDGHEPLALCRRDVPDEDEEAELRTVLDDKTYRAQIKDALRPGALGHIREAVQGADAEDLEEARDNIEGYWEDLEEIAASLGLNANPGNVIGLLVALAAPAEARIHDDED